MKRKVSWDNLTLHSIVSYWFHVKGALDWQRNVQLQSFLTFPTINFKLHTLWRSNDTKSEIEQVKEECEVSRENEKSECLWNVEIVVLAFHSDLIKILTGSCSRCFQIVYHLEFGLCCTWEDLLKIIVIKRWFVLIRASAGWGKFYLTEKWTWDISCKKVWTKIVAFLMHFSVCSAIILNGLCSNFFGFARFRNHWCMNFFPGLIKRLSYAKLFFTEHFFFFQTFSNHNNNEHQGLPLVYMKSETELRIESEKKKVANSQIFIYSLSICFWLGLFVSAESGNRILDQQK